MILNIEGYQNTEDRITDFLDAFTGMYAFTYCLVNMAEMERRLIKKDIDLLSILSEKEMDYLEKLKIKKNQVQWAAGRYAVKSALFKYTMLDPSGMDVLKGEDMAPYILQYPDICASITHSFPYCIGVVAKNKIGLDLEKITDPKETLIKHFYSQKEQEVLKEYKGIQAYAGKAMQYWTRKEAASKFVKMGMKLEFKKLDTTEDIIRINDCGIRLKSVIWEDFCLSLALEEF